jgi:pimeloyl-ACP methyl ester carboxylesterase
VVEHLVEAERPFAGPSFDETGMRELAGRVFDRTPELEAQLTGSFEFDAGDPWRERLGDIAAPVLVAHGSDDPLFPLAHARALAEEIPGAELLALEQTGHEYFPRATWDVVVPALLRHTAAR